MKALRWQAIQASLFSFAVALLLTGCGGGGGGGGGNPLASLEGTWGGAAFIVSQGVNRDFALDVDASGQITDVRINGMTPPSGSTGTIAHEQGNIFSFTLDDGTEGGFMTDAARAHAGFLLEDGSFGVVQKGASGPATSYTNGDVQRNWSGYSVELDSDMNVTAQGSSSATHIGAGSFDVSDINGPVSASLSLLNPLFGDYFGTWNGGGESGQLEAWLSQDKRFAATWACNPGPLGGSATFPTCTFAIWNAQ